MKVSNDELLAAAEWLDYYESETDPSDNVKYRRVAIFLRETVARRNFDSAVRQIVSETGVSRATARKRLREAMSR